MEDSQQFEKQAEGALERLYRVLVPLSDEHGFEVDRGAALTVEFEEPPGKFVVSPNAPVRQIWVSAHSTSYKLDWSAEQACFVHAATGLNLEQLLLDAVRRQLKVTF